MLGESDPNKLVVSVILYNSYCPDGYVTDLTNLMSCVKCYARGGCDLNFFRLQEDRKIASEITVLSLLCACLLIRLESSSSRFMEYHFLEGIRKSSESFFSHLRISIAPVKTLALSCKDVPRLGLFWLGKQVRCYSIKHGNSLIIM